MVAQLNRTQVESRAKLDKLQTEARHLGDMGYAVKIELQMKEKECADLAEEVEHRRARRVDLLTQTGNLSDSVAAGHHQALSLREQADTLRRQLQDLRIDISQV